ncbi:MAG: AI-2E family transporter [Microgenomates group bacterium]
MLQSIFGHSTKTVHISLSSVFNAVMLVLFLYGMYLIQSILILVFLGFILMVAINPLVKLLQKWAKIPRAMGIAISYVALMTLLTLSVAIIIPPLAVEITALVKSIPIPVLQEQIADLRFTVQEWNTVIERVGTSLPLLYNVISTTFNSIFGFVTLLVITFYMLYERPILYKKIGWFTNNKKHFAQAEEFLDTLEFQLGGWVRGQLILMIVVGLMTYVGLSLLSIPYAVPLAITAAFLEILPNLGPTLAAIPSIFIAYITFGPAMAGIILLLYIIIQQLENTILVPKIMKVNANVDPLASILLILVGNQLAGIPGALLAIPFYIVARLVFSTFRHKIFD